MSEMCFDLLEGQLRDVSTIAVIGDRPANVPSDWLIFTALRPLAGHVQWESDFTHGIFYAGIDPAEENAVFLIQRNGADACLSRCFSRMR